MEDKDDGGASPSFDLHQTVDFAHAQSFSLQEIYIVILVKVSNVTSA